jgi:glycosyltransferase involved in cell wall biosynthesis
MCAPDEAVRRAVRLKYGVREDQTVAIYSGAMGRSNAMADVAGAVAATSVDERIVWWFAGDGPERAYCDHGVVAMASVKTGAGRAGARAGHAMGDTCGESPEEGPDDHGVVAMASVKTERVRSFGRLAKEEVVALVRAADVNVVTFRHEPLFFENSPNKFFDGIAAGVPALFNRSTWLEPWLKAYDCGVVCKGERPGEEMAEALRALAGDPARRRRMGLGARLLAEEVFDRDKLAAEYLAVLLRPRSGRNGECKNGGGAGGGARGACDGGHVRGEPGDKPG